MDTTDFAAWYGAVVATLVLVWDVIKWRKTGPNITADVRTGMNLTNDEKQDRTFTSVQVTNRGDKPTTIGSMAYFLYRDKAANKDKAPERSYIVRPGYLRLNNYSKLLSPGEVWMGVIEEDDEYKEFYSTGKVRVSLSLSHLDSDMFIDVPSS